MTAAVTEALWRYGVPWASKPIEWSKPPRQQIAEPDPDVTVEKDTRNI